MATPDVQVVRGDITALGRHVDAIVNAANSGLLGGGGVDGAIHRRGGPEVLAACRELRASTLVEGLPTGRAVATTAGRLDARWAVHTVGPVHSTRTDRTALLESCYRECLRVCDELGAASVAFPTISAGIYGWPVQQATEVAVRTVLQTPTRVREVLLVAFGDDAERGYRDALQRALG